jgi:hypothetical protein
VIGHPPIVGRKPFEKTSTRSFSNWHDVWIVDPWANISCPAPQYIGRIIAKMKKWEADGKKIIDGVARIDPTDSEWINDLRNSRKERVEAPSPKYPNPWAYYPIDLVP